MALLIVKPLKSSVEIIGNDVASHGVEVVPEANLALSTVLLHVGIIDSVVVILRMHVK